MIIARRVSAATSVARSFRRVRALSSFRLTHETDSTRESISDTVQALCKNFPGSYWRELDSKSEYPTSFVDSLAEAGILGLMIPEKYGGSNLTLREACTVLETIHRCGCNGGAAHAQMYMMQSLVDFGSEIQKKKLLPKIATNEIRFQSFGVTEPNSGTDTLALETTATDGGDSFVINGQKMWTSRAEHSDLMLLLARTRPEKSPNSLTTFLVDMKSPGISIDKIDAMINHSTTAVFFDNVRVPKSSILGQLHGGFKVVLSAMNAERALIASECVGDAKFFVKKASAYATERKVFGKPIGSNQAVSFPIAQVHAETEAASLMVESACAKILDPNTPRAKAGAAANMAKLLASEASFKAADICMQTYGGLSFAKEYDIERKWRETRLYRIAPISTNLILSHVATAELGMPKSY